MRVSRMILLLKLCMKKALSSFRGTNHRQVLFWEGQQSAKTDPQLLSGQQNQESSQRSAGRQADTEMPLLQKFIPKLGICTLLLPKLLCEWPQQSAPRMKQMEEEFRASAACQKCLLPEERDHGDCMHTPACPKPVCHLPQFKYCLVQLHICVSNDRMHLSRSSKDWWFIYGIMVW